MTPCVGNVVLRRRPQSKFYVNVRPWLLGGSIYNLKKNAEALVPAAKQNGLEVSADKTKYMVKSREIIMQDKFRV